MQETVDKTLLKNKLGVEEVEGTVTAISKTGKLDENEFELEMWKTDWHL